MKPQGSCPRNRHRSSSSRTRPAIPTIAAVTDRPDPAAPGSAAPGSTTDDEAAGITLLEFFAHALRRLLAGERSDLDSIEHAVGGLGALEDRRDVAEHRPQIAHEQIPGASSVRLAPDRGQLNSVVATGRYRQRGARRGKRSGLGRPLP